MHFTLGKEGMIQRRAGRQGGAITKVLLGQHVPELKAERGTFRKLLAD